MLKIKSERGKGWKVLNKHTNTQTIERIAKPKTELQLWQRIFRSYTQKLISQRDKCQQKRQHTSRFIDAISALAFDFFLFDSFSLRLWMFATLLLLMLLLFLSSSFFLFFYYQIFCSFFRSMDVFIPIILSALFSCIRIAYSTMM